MTHDVMSVSSPPTAVAKRRFNRTSEVFIFMDGHDKSARVDPSETDEAEDVGAGCCVLLEASPLDDISFPNVGSTSPTDCTSGTIASSSLSSVA